MLFGKGHKKDLLKIFGMTDIQLIPDFVYRLSSKYHANGSVVEAGVAPLTNTFLPEKDGTNRTRFDY